VKRVALISIVLIAIIFAWVGIYRPPTNHPNAQRVVTVLATPTPVIAKPDPAITLGGLSYAYSYFSAATPSSVSLIPNFTQQKEAKTLSDTNGCRAAINGGFYDKTNKPLGYFYTAAHVYGAQIQSDLVNGFFWADTDGTAVISTDLPISIPYRFALQSGPLLLFDDQPIPLTINNDEHARRMVVAKTMDNQFIFLTVYTKDSVFDGPLLADLPAAVTLVSTKEHLDIADALNLDGGSASSFYTEGTQLSELAPIGSMLCVK
jgi:uncharacterized protein YigE (DUF2233 family)